MPRVRPASRTVVPARCICAATNRVHEARSAEGAPAGYGAHAAKQLCLTLITAVQAKIVLIAFIDGAAVGTISPTGAKAICCPQATWWHSVGAKGLQISDDDARAHEGEQDPQGSKAGDRTIVTDHVV